MLFTSCLRSPDGPAQLLDADHPAAAELENGIDPSAMVKLINELESTGLGKRERRPGDRRAWRVSITPKGRRTLERARRLVTQVEDEVLGGLTVADRHQLLTLLRRALVSAPPQPPWRPEEGD